MGVGVHSIQKCGFDEGMWLFAVVAARGQLETHLLAFLKLSSSQIKALPPLLLYYTHTKVYTFPCSITMHTLTAEHGHMTGS